jgi:hypothetical protein
MRSEGYVAYMREIRNKNKISVRKPEGKNSLERRKHR